MTKAAAIRQVSATLPDTSRDIMDDFRRWGYLQANLDLLGQYLQPQVVPELDEVPGDSAGKAMPIAVHPERADEGAFMVRDGEQGNHMEHGDPFVEFWCKCPRGVAQSDSPATKKLRRV